MAERRMFAKTIIDSDAFLDMPLTTQALYFHLSMRSDDEGFINNPKKIARMIGCSDDDLKVLEAKNFIIRFESGVVVIKHWRMHNIIKMDRFKPTVYQEEKSMLHMKQNKAYTLEEPDGNQLEPNWNQNGTKTEPNWNQNGNQLEPQVNISKVNISEVKKKKEAQAPFFPDHPKAQQAFEEYIKHRKAIKVTMTDQAKTMAANKLQKLAQTNGAFDEDKAVQIINTSILNGWKGLFELKEDRQMQTRPAKPGFMEFAQTKNDEALDEIEALLLQEVNG